MDNILITKGFLSIIRNRLTWNVIRNFISELNDIHSHGYSYRYSEINSIRWILKNNYLALLHDKVYKSIVSLSEPSNESIRLLFSKVDDTDLLLRIINHFGDIFKNEYWCIDSAAPTGNLKLVKALLDIGMPFTNHAIDNSVKKGHLDMVRLLLESKPANDPENPMFTNSLDLAAEHGYFEMVQYLHERPGSFCSVYAIDKASHNAHFEIVDFLLKNRTEGYSLDAVVGHIKHGRYEDVKRMIKKSIFKTNHMLKIEPVSEQVYGSEMVHACASYGQLKILKLLEKETKYVESIRPNLFETAVGEGHIEIAAYLADTYDLDHNQLGTALEFVCLKGNFPTVEHLLLKTKIKFPLSYRYMECAASSGNIDIVRLLHEIRPNDPQSIYSLQSSAKQGNIEVFKFLFENQSRTNLQPEAINIACSFNNIEIVKFIMENASGIVDIREAIDRACYANDLDIVRYLTENSINRICNPKSLNLCACHDNIPLIRYICTEYKDQFTQSNYSQAMSIAAEKGYFEIVKYLHQHHKVVELTDYIYKSALEQRELRVAKYLHQHFEKKYLKFQLSYLLSIAAKHEDIRLINFLMDEKHNFELNGVYEPILEETGIIGDPVLLKMVLPILYKYFPTHYSKKVYEQPWVSHAINSGNFNLVKYWKFFEDNSTDFDIGLACDRNHLKMVEYMLNEKKSFRTEYPGYILRQTSIKGNLTLLQHCFRDESVTDIRSVFDGASNRSNLAIVKWLLHITNFKKVMLPNNMKNAYQFPKINETIVDLTDYVKIYIKLK